MKEISLSAAEAVDLGDLFTTVFSQKQSLSTAEAVDLGDN